MKAFNAQIPMPEGYRLLYDILNILYTTGHICLEVVFNDKLHVIEVVVVTTFKDILAIQYILREDINRIKAKVDIEDAKIRQGRHTF